MEKLIFRKFTKDFINFFILTSCSIALIVWVIQAVNFLDFVSEDGHSFRVYFLYTLLTLPKIVSRILPFIFFVSLFYSLLKYEENNELIIFWTVGIKKIQFINVLIKLSFFFILLQIFLSAYLVPKTQDMARSFIRSSNIDFFPSLIKEKKFIDTLSNLTIFVDRIKEDGELQNIFLKDKFNRNQSQIIYAKKGNIVINDNQRFLILYDGKFINNDFDKTTMFSFNRTEFNLAKYSTKTTVMPKIQELSTSLLLKCFRLLNKDIRKNFVHTFLICDEKIFRGIKQELFQRVILPFYLPLIALFACLLILKSKDDYKFTKFKLFLFSLGTITIVISEISKRYSGINDTYSIVSSGAPLVLFILIYMFVNRKLNL